MSVDIIEELRPLTGGIIIKLQITLAHPIGWTGSFLINSYDFHFYSILM